MKTEDFDWLSVWHNREWLSTNSFGFSSFSKVKVKHWKPNNKCEKILNEKKIRLLIAFFEVLFSYVKHYVYLTIIAQKRAWYRLILRRRGRRPSWLELGDITQA